MINSMTSHARLMGRPFVSSAGGITVDYPCRPHSCNEYHTCLGVVFLLESLSYYWWDAQGVRHLYQKPKEGKDWIRRSLGGA